MKHRTQDKGFFPCPICGRRPYVTYYPPNTGWAECEGTFFRPHDRITVYVEWEIPSKLTKTLASKWNQGWLLTSFEQEGVEE